MRYFTRLQYTMARMNVFDALELGEINSISNPRRFSVITLSLTSSFQDLRVIRLASLSTYSPTNPSSFPKTITTPAKKMFTSSPTEDIEKKSWSPNCIKVPYERSAHDEEETDDEEGTDSYESEDGTDDDNVSVNDDMEKEADYDDVPTTLYLHLEDRLWDKAILRLRENKRGPSEARTWIYRLDDSNADKKAVRWRILPIHASCIFRAPLTLIEALVQAFPQGLEKPDDQEMLPLHLACRNGASKLVVSKLVEAYPNAVFGKDRKGRTPLDLAQTSASHHRNEVVEVLKYWMQKLDTATNINLTPVKTKQKDDARSKKGESHSSTPTGSLDLSSPPKALDTTPTAEKSHTNDDRTLLFQFILKKDWTGIIQRCQTHPEEASTFITTKGVHGQLHFLPLHKICVLQPPVDAVKAIIAAFPSGPASQDQDGWLPLHCACYYGATYEVIASLLSSFVKGAQSRDGEGGRTPLHYACIKHASVDTLQLLIRTNPKSLLIRDDDGRLPIHYACSKGASTDIIDTLLTPCPKSAGRKDDLGRLPLHLACRKYLREKTVSSLLSASPESALERDDDNKLPIHYACKFAIDCANKFTAGTTAVDEINMKEAYLVIQQLLIANPSGATTEDNSKVHPLMEVRSAMVDSTFQDSIVRNEKLATILSLLENFVSDGTRDHTDKIEVHNIADEIQDPKVELVALEKRVLELELLVRDLAAVCKELSKAAFHNDK